MSSGSSAPGLFGRGVECGVLDQILAQARAGRSQVLVVRGEAGIGKSALLDYLSHGGEGFRIAKAVGAEAEAELAFAGLHQLCGPTRRRRTYQRGDRRRAVPQPTHRRMAPRKGFAKLRVNSRRHLRQALVRAEQSVEFLSGST